MANPAATHLPHSPSPRSAPYPHCPSCTTGCWAGGAGGKNESGPVELRGSVWAAQERRVAARAGRISMGCTSERRVAERAQISMAVQERRSLRKYRGPVGCTRRVAAVPRAQIKCTTWSCRAETQRSTNVWAAQARECSESQKSTGYRHPPVSVGSTNCRGTLVGCVATTHACSFSLSEFLKARHLKLPPGEEVTIKSAMASTRDGWKMWTTVWGEGGIDGGGGGGGAVLAATLTKPVRGRRMNWQLRPMSRPREFRSLF